MRQTISSRFVQRASRQKPSLLLVLSVAAVVGGGAHALVTTSISALSRNIQQTTMCFTRKGAEEAEPVEDVASSGEPTNHAQTWNPLRLAVLKLGLTEPAWTSPWNYQKKQGSFKCAFCGAQLFESNAKYDSGSGWPSFWRTSADGSVELKREFDGRVECRCQKCSSHLGHVFMDGPALGDVSQELLQSAPATDPRSTSGTRLPRYCVNGAALMFDETQSNDVQKG